MQQKYTVYNELAESLVVFRCAFILSVFFILAFGDEELSLSARALLLVLFAVHRNLLAIVVPLHVSVLVIDVALEDRVFVLVYLLRLQRHDERLTRLCRISSNVIYESANESSFILTINLKNLFHKLF